MKFCTQQQMDKRHVIKKKENFQNSKGKKGKGSGFIWRLYCSTSHSRRAQVRITQCYLQITPYLPPPRKHSPDGASPD